MKQTPNVERSTPNVEFSPDASPFGVGRSALGVRRFLWRVLDVAVGGVFVIAALTKLFNLDNIISELWHLRFRELIVDLPKIPLADPMSFAMDIDNYKILPWPIAVALALYLPWLELLAGVSVIFRRFYRGALSILLALISIFIAATIAAKARGLDITCGCFGHASQHWSFPSHMAVDLAIFAALLVLALKSANENRSVA